MELGADLPVAAAVNYGLGFTAQLWISAIEVKYAKH